MRYLSLSYSLRTGFGRLLGLGVLLWLTAIPLRAQVAVVAHQEVSEDVIDRSRLLDFYTGDIRRWNGGERVVVFDLKEKGETRDTFFDYVGKSSSRMRTIWLKRMLAGEGDPPEALDSEEAMLVKVANTPGAIGFVSEARVDESVKVLLVIEKKNE